MKKHFLILLSFVVLTVNAENTLPGFVASIEFRDSGYHAVYFSKDLLTMGCDLDDRAIIVANEEGSEGLMMAARMSFENRFYNAVVRTSGCVAITPETTLTAPKVVRIQISR